MKISRYIMRQSRWLFSLLIILSLSACDDGIDKEAFTPEIPKLSLSDEQLKISNGSGEYITIINSNLPWRAETNSSWLELINNSGQGTDTLAFKVGRNTIPEERTAEVSVWILSDEKLHINVTQALGEVSPETRLDVYVKVDGTGDGSSWAQATTLEEAMKMELVDNDIIHIAAGTYRPLSAISGGIDDNEKDFTFEIKHNISLIGGYPADAVEGAVSNPAANPTIFSGSLSSGTRVNHTMVIAAPITDNRSVFLKGITIQDALGDGTEGDISINGLSIQRNWGGGLVVAASRVKMSECKVTNNIITGHGIGVYAWKSELNMDGCIVSNNTSSGSSNGGGIYFRESAGVIINTTISSNVTTSGVGAGIQVYGAGSDVRIYNSTIANNQGGGYAGGIYVRNDAKCTIVNSTIYGNKLTKETNKGSAIHTYTNAVVDVISSTITANEGSYAVGLHNGTCTINFYNSIISGNIDGDSEAGFYNTGTLKLNKSVSMDKVLDENGDAVAGLSFDASTMLSPLQDNGGLTQNCLLIGDANPARDAGMTTSQLHIAGNNAVLQVEKEVTAQDQNGLSREGKATIGSTVK